MTYALLGPDGTRFLTGTEKLIMFPRANEQFRLSVTTRKELPPNIEAATISCRVLAVEEGNDLGGFERATESDTCTVLGIDSSGNIQVALKVTSPYEKTTKVQTWWALQAPGPVRFDTGTDVVDLVGAGETFQISQDYGPKKPAWIGDGEVTCAVVGSGTKVGEVTRAVLGARAETTNGLHKTECVYGPDTNG